jgi:hypothetical protein
MLEQDLNKPRLRRRLSAAQWQVVFEDWRLSGLSRTHYCQLQGITLSCFARWYQRLSVGQMGPASDSPSSSPSHKSDKVDAVWASFIPVGVDDVSVGTVPGLKLDVTLSGGTRVCVEGVLWRDVLQFLSRSMRC